MKTVIDPVARVVCAECEEVGTLEKEQFRVYKKKAYCSDECQRRGTRGPVMTFFLDDDGPGSWFWSAANPKPKKYESRRIRVSSREEAKAVARKYKMEAVFI